MKKPPGTAQRLLDELRIHPPTKKVALLYIIAMGVLLIALGVTRLARATEQQGRRMDRISEVLLRTERSGGFLRR